MGALGGARAGEDAVIAGIGMDLVHVPGFRQQLAQPGTSFAAGTFTPAERAEARGRPGGDEALHLAARFAAKEAFVKAWSVANRSRAPALTHLDLREIEVACDRWGRPALQLHGRVLEAVEAAGIGIAHVSLTHDGPTAAAVVVLERA